MKGVLTMEKKDLERKNREYREEIEKLLEEKQYLENYLYAEYIINAFIKDGRSYQKGRFYRITRTNRKMFEYCVEVVRFLNPSLYQNYMEAVKRNEVKKIEDMNANINLLVQGIRTGHLKDGSLYDILDFYRFVPLRECGLDFVSELKKFMRHSDGLVEGAYETMTKYMEENNINEIIFATENYVLSNKSIVNFDKRATPEVIHNCYRYMFASGLPKIEGVFKIVFKRYLNGEIDFNDLERLENKSQKSKRRKSYQNPHKLELRNGLNNEKK